MIKIFAALLTVLFIGLKLTNYIAWSWIWVLSPLWIVITLWIILIIIVVLATGEYKGKYYL